MSYLSTRREIEGALPTAAEMLRLKQEFDSLSVLTLADIEFAQTGYDNWDEVQKYGQYTYAFP